MAIPPHLRRHVDLGTASTDECPRRELVNRELAVFANLSWFVRHGTRHRRKGANLLDELLRKGCRVVIHRCIAQAHLSRHANQLSATDIAMPPTAESQGV